MHTVVGGAMCSWWVGTRHPCLWKLFYSASSHCCIEVCIVTHCSCSTSWACTGLGLTLPVPSSQSSQCGLPSLPSSPAPRSYLPHYMSVNQSVMGIHVCVYVDYFFSRSIPGLSYSGYSWQQVPAYNIYTHTPTVSYNGERDTHGNRYQHAILYPLLVIMGVHIHPLLVIMGKGGGPGNTPLMLLHSHIILYRMVPPYKCMVSSQVIRNAMFVMPHGLLTQSS